MNISKVMRLAVHIFFKELKRPIKGRSSLSSNEELTGKRCQGWARDDKGGVFF